MKAQIVLEFLLIISLAVIIGVMYIAVGTHIFVDVNEQQRVAALNDVGYLIQDEVVLAASVEDGYTRTFVLPQKADRFTYTITNSNTSVTLASADVTLSYPLPMLSGNLVMGANIP
jgi:hypothetical protein